MVGQVGKNTGISMEFMPMLEVTTTEFVRPLVSGLLSDMGGSMGLWLGLGVLQALQMGATCLRPLAGSRFRNQPQGK